MATGLEDVRVVRKKWLTLLKLRRTSTTLPWYNKMKLKIRLVNCNGSSSRERGVLFNIGNFYDQAIVVGKN